MKLALKYVWLLEILSVFVHLRNESDDISGTMYETVGKCSPQRHCSWTYWWTHTRLDHRPIAAVSIFCLCELHSSQAHALSHQTEFTTRCTAVGWQWHTPCTGQCFEQKLLQSASCYECRPTKKRPSILINKHPQSFGKRTHNTAFDVYGKVHK